MALSAHRYDGWLKDSLVAYKSGRLHNAFGLADVITRTIPFQGTCIPVPSTPSKVRERGYDTIGHLTSLVAKTYPAMRVLPALEYSRLVADQVGLGAAARRTNVAGAFRAIRRVPREVIVIDDVVTTGSTVIECAKALKMAGAQKVYVFALCASVNRG